MFISFYQKCVVRCFTALNHTFRLYLDGNPHNKQGNSVMPQCEQQYTSTPPRLIVLTLGVRVYDHRKARGRASVTHFSSSVSSNGLSSANMTAVF